MLTAPKTCSFNVVIKSLSCGFAHTCFVSDQGHIYSMGSNQHGQLGLGDKAVLQKSTPSNVESLVDYFVCSVACGSEHTLALTENGLCFSWGKGKYGALGNGQSNDQFEPNHIALQEPIIEIEAGANHSAFISQTYTLYMCGSNSHGQLGLGENSSGSFYNVAKVAEKIAKVACGEKHSMLITQEQRRVMVTGANDMLQLGLGA